ncbi:MAG TPA: ABC transporter permease [Candidatus Aminicenantes bacterium]|mgnify:CR=1 FL=1|nr:ABC transporter permease [Candidatus Aminicenantes bacterium]
MNLGISPKSRVSRLFRSPSFRALAALALVIAIGCVFNAEGTFFRWHTHRDMLRHISVFGILACGMTLVIITSGIDLAVGSVLGLSAVLFSLFSLQLGWPAWLAVPTCLTAGAACGLTSGGLIARFKIQPFIATLAMMVFARGLAKWVSGGRKISTAVQLADGSFEYREAPGVFRILGSKLFGGNIAVVTLIFLACALVCYVLLARLRLGRQLFAIGGNEEAARLSGVPVSAAKLLAYGLCGLLSAAAGICHAVQEQQGDPEAGAGYELTAIAIVVIGGTSMLGGKGGMGLTLNGAMAIGYLEKILSLNAVGEATRLMLTGLIIVGAVLFQKHRK